MKRIFPLSLIFSCLLVPVVGGEIFLGQGSMVGEVSQAGAILQTRLPASEQLVEGDLPGAAGVARFELGTTKELEQAKRTPWLKAQAANDFMVVGLMALTSFSAGTLEEMVGWRTMNQGAVPFLLVVMLAITVLQVRRRLRARPKDQ